MTALALLLTAALFGGMLLYSFGFAAFLFRHMPKDEAGRLLRRAFPVYYLLVIAVASTAALLRLPADPTSAALLAAVALTTIPARQVLMPQINAASDAGDRRRFGWLHGASVALGLLQIAATAIALLRFL
ncbi:DUF4149 domain-containing protein [Litorisediminicola beolgyonensis]|uniref:DUF4149 domain-containing protein n=1 Tax=Litorisediminicola beolgyonensis TaxID=1173614 RepID=A0ABW3ZGH9_9RHOB